MNKRLLGYCLSLWIGLFLMGLVIMVMADPLTTTARLLLYLFLLAGDAVIITASVVNIATFLSRQAQSQNQS